VCVGGGGEGGRGRGALTLRDFHKIPADGDTVFVGEKMTIECKKQYQLASAPRRSDPLRRSSQACDDMLFIGTRFSNLYTAVDTPA
jgi:hypothetical protein